jgi:hypothetical protein
MLGTFTATSGNLFTLLLYFMLALHNRGTLEEYFSLSPFGQVVNEYALDKKRDWLYEHLAILLDKLMKKLQHLE